MPAQPQKSCDKEICDKIFCHTYFCHKTANGWNKGQPQPLPGGPFMQSGPTNAGVVQGQSRIGGFVIRKTNGACFTGCKPGEGVQDFKC
jgi:hypothetical protein